VARIAVSLTMLGAWIAFAVAAERSPARVPTSSRGSIVAARHPVARVTGRARGLFPGKMGTLHVIVRNVNHDPIWVRRVSARVGDAGQGCSGSVLKVTPLLTRLRIGAGKRIGANLTIKMLPSAPDACQGATFPVTFRTRTTSG
jgi:hypothetical protein